MQCSIIKCSDLYGHVQRCNWNCAEHKLDLRDFFCISALSHGEVVSLTSRHKEKDSPSRLVAAGFLKLNSTEFHSFERTRLVRRSHLFCTNTWQVGLKEMTKHIKHLWPQKSFNCTWLGAERLF